MIGLVFQGIEESIVRSVTDSRAILSQPAHSPSPISGNSWLAACGSMRLEQSRYRCHIADLRQDSRTVIRPGVHSALIGQKRSRVERSGARTLTRADGRNREPGERAYAEDLQLASMSENPGGRCRSPVHQPDPGEPSPVNDDDVTVEAADFTSNIRWRAAHPSRCASIWRRKDFCGRPGAHLAILISTIPIALVLARQVRTTGITGESAERLMRLRASPAQKLNGQ